MKGLVFWVEGPIHTAWELWQEPLRMLCEALSESLPIWLVQWHSHTTAPAYQMAIWNGYGREIIFEGAWKSRKIIRLLSDYWYMEEFRPALIVHVYAEGASLVSRLKKRFGAPVMELSDRMRWWPYSGFSSELAAEWRRLVIPVDGKSQQAAYRIGSAALEKGWSVLFTGWAWAVTPFRRLHSRYAERVSIHFGLSWMELEGLLGRCKAVVLPSSRPLVFALGWGLPVFYPGPLPWEMVGAYSYSSLDELWTFLAQHDLSAIPQRTLPEIVAEWIRWYDTTEKDPDSAFTTDAKS